MPFRSESQRRYLYSQHPEIAKRWAKKTPKGADLPEHIGKASEAFAGSFSNEEAANAAKRLKVDFEKRKFTLAAFQRGMNVEREHGDVSHAATTIGKIALAHLHEDPKYYEKLARMEGKAKPDLAEMSPKQADAWQSATVDQPEYPEPQMGLPPQYGLPVIGKLSETVSALQAKLMLRKEPAGPQGPAPMRGKMSLPLEIIQVAGRGGNLHSALGTENLEPAPAKPDFRPSLAGANYTADSTWFAASRCETCAHSTDRFSVRPDYAVFGLRCAALQDEPLVANRGHCDLWTGTHLKSGALIPVRFLLRKALKRKPKGGPYIGPKGGMWEDVLHTRHWTPGTETEDPRAKLARRLRAKTRRRAPGQGGEVHISKAELREVLNHTRFAIVSAGKSPQDSEDFTPQQAAQRHQKLKQRLVREGYMFTKAMGKYDEVEDSFLVMIHDANREHVRGIGREFNQDSVIYSDNGFGEGHYTTGPHADKNECSEGPGWTDETKADNYYTEITHPNGTKSKFQLGIDFNKYVPCRKSMLSKGMDGGGPQRDYDQQQSLPDYQEIYYPLPSKETSKKEREATEIRRRAMAERNSGVFGIHGEAPEPQLRYISNDDEKSAYSRKDLGNPKPRVLPDRIFARMSGVKPPPGFSAAPKSKKGGYVKVTGKKRVYWYPGDPLPVIASEKKKEAYKGGARFDVEDEVKEGLPPHKAIRWKHQIITAADIGDTLKVSGEWLDQDEGLGWSGGGGGGFSQWIALPDRTLTITARRKGGHRRLVRRYHAVDEKGEKFTLAQDWTTALHAGKQLASWHVYKGHLGEDGVEGRTNRITALQPMNREYAERVHERLGELRSIETVERVKREEQKAKRLAESEASHQRELELDQRHAAERVAREEAAAAEHKEAQSKAVENPFAGKKGQKRNANRFDAGVDWMEGKLDDPSSMLRIASRKTGVPLPKKITAATVRQIADSDPFWGGVAAIAYGASQTDSGKNGAAKAKRQQATREKQVAAAAKGSPYRSAEKRVSYGKGKLFGEKIGDVSRAKKIAKKKAMAVLFPGGSDPNRSEMLSEERHQYTQERRAERKGRPRKSEESWDEDIRLADPFWYGVWRWAKESGA